VEQLGSSNARGTVQQMRPTRLITGKGTVYQVHGWGLTPCNLKLIVSANSLTMNLFNILNGSEGTFRNVEETEATGIQLITDRSTVTRVKAR
jgi:hypothetical protein